MKRKELAYVVERVEDYSRLKTGNFLFEGVFGGVVNAIETNGSQSETLFFERKIR